MSLIDTASSTCGSLGLPALPTGYVYHCATATSSRLTNGQGWIPISFSSSTNPLGALPLDPQNSSSTGLYYTYVTNGNQYELTAVLESQKQKAALGFMSMISNYPEVLAQGSNLTINPLWSTQGLVGYWNLDEGTGTVALDLSGNNNNGGWSGTTPYYAGGKVGGGGMFDGASDYVNLGTGITFSSSSPWTFACWMDWNGQNSTYVFYAGSQITVKAILMRYNNNNQFSFRDEIGNYTLWSSNSSNPFIGVWTDVVWVADGSGNLRLYINGNLFETQKTGVDTAFTLKSMGAGYPTSSPYLYSGLLDDARIYNRALSAAEVMALYNAEK